MTQNGMTTVQALKQMILKEVDLNGEAHDDWDEGFDAALRLVLEWTRKIEQEES